LGSSPKEIRALRPGDVVVIKSAAEILATLDDQAALDMLPFMPEMIPHIGKRFTVARRVDKICDTITYSGSRRMQSVVYLEDLECNGSCHGGCQAGCKIYWKDAWMRRVTDDAPVSSDAEDSAKTAELQRLTQSGSRTTRELDGVPTEVWRCQATEAVKATTRLSGYDLGQYWRELTNGNFSLFRFLHIMARAVVMQIATRLGVLSHLPLRGPGTLPNPPNPLGLKPGDFVQVRSPSEISATLDQEGQDRGLSFDREMLPFCGKTYRVKDKVQKLVDDKSGRLLNIRRDCVILEGVVCSGERSISCWFCPRQIYPYFRESWLRPVPPPQSGQVPK